MNDKHPELPLDCIPVFDLDIERTDAWPMPPVRPWPLKLQPAPAKRNVFTEVLFGIFK